MQHIKVCHITTVHPAEDIRIFHKECVSLVSAGYEVFLIQRGASYEKNGVHIVGLGNITSQRLKRMSAGARLAYKTALKLDCDIYHLHDPELLSFALKLKNKGKKVVFDSHELTRVQIRGKKYLSPIVAKIASGLYSRYEDHVLSKIDGVIFPCPVSGQFPLPARNRAFLNNVPRLSEIYDRYDPQAEKEPNTICTVGSLTYSRGIKHMILAAHQAGCKAILAGDIRPAAFKSELLEMPEAKGSEFLGRINRERVVETYKRSIIGVSSILNVGQYDKVENLPTKAYEFMAMGLPVILTRNSYNEKMAEEYRFGICIDPENIEEFSASIRKLLENPDLANELGKNGRKAIKEKFNWELEQENLFQLYKTVLESDA